MDFSAIKKPNDAVTAKDIKAWIAENGEIPEGSIVFMRTGMDRFVYQDNFNREWIGFSEDAAELLVKKGIKVIGTDACSIDSVAGHPRCMTVYRLHTSFSSEPVSRTSKICAI